MPTVYVYDVCVCCGEGWQTHTDAKHFLGREKLPKVNADARATLAAEQLIFLLGVETILGQTIPGLAMPLDLLPGRV